MADEKPTPLPASPTAKLDDVGLGSVAELGAEAQVGTTVEHTLGVRAACARYPKAIAWSMFFSIGIIMCGFDPQLITNLYGVPRFQRDFGYYSGGEYVVAASWQTGLSMGNPIGQVIGALVAGYPMEMYGRKWTFAACVVGTAGLIFFQFFARSLQVLLAGELIGGLVLGSYTVIAPAYASEVCPAPLRGIFTSYINLCFVIGQLIANGITAGTETLDTHWAYSGPFASQWFWCLVILLGIAWAPESPYYLVRKGRFEEAEHALRRLASPGVDVKPALALVVETDRLEQEMEAGSTYWDCFNKLNRRRTEIAIGVYSIQPLSGIYLVGYATYFFEQAGLPDDKSFDMGVGFLAVGFVGTILAWYLMNHFGRRTIYTSGLAVMTVLLLLIGILDCVPGDRSGVKWAESSLMVVWNFFYDVSVGPVAFVLLCECSATKVRSKTIAVATAVQALFAIVMSVAIPYMINPDEANMQGKLGFFYGGLAAICLVWAYFRIPETRNRTYAELDIMFERNVRTREFGDYVIGEMPHGGGFHDQVKH